MHGPVWNDPNVGVTGEPKFRTQEPNTFTTERDGRTVTFVGADADRERAKA